MLQLVQSLKAWQTDNFDRTLKQEISRLPSDALPLHHAVTQGGYVDGSDITLSLLSSRDTPSALQIKTGVFFTEIVINCGCGDDPMPINNFCEMMISIDKISAVATFTILND